MTEMDLGTAYQNLISAREQTKIARALLNRDWEAVQNLPLPLRVIARGLEALRIDKTQHQLEVQYEQEVDRTRAKRAFLEGLVKKQPGRRKFEAINYFSKGEEETGLISVTFSQQFGQDVVVVTQDIHSIGLIFIPGQTEPQVIIGTDDYSYKQQLGELTILLPEDRPLNVRKWQLDRPDHLKIGNIVTVNPDLDKPVTLYTSF